MSTLVRELRCAVTVKIRVFADVEETVAYAKPVGCLWGAMGQTKTSGGLVAAARRGMAPTGARRSRCGLCRRRRIAAAALIAPTHASSTVDAASLAALRVCV